MKNFSVIKGKEKRNYKPTREQYENASDRLIEKLKAGKYEPREEIKKLIFLRVRELSKHENYKYLEEGYIHILLDDFFNTTECMAALTPKEFMQIFPITKTYNGEKYQVKDYFSTTKEIQKYDPDSMIGDRIEEFLMEYWNWDIIEFQVCKLSCMSAARRLMGQSGIMEEWAEKEGIPTYTLYDEEKIMVNNSTGEVIKVKKLKSRKPKYLKVVGAE